MLQRRLFHNTDDDWDRGWLSGDRTVGFVCYHRRDF